MKKLTLLLYFGFTMGLSHRSFSQCDSLPVRIPELVFGTTNEINLLYSQLLDSLLYITRADYILASTDTRKNNRYGRFGKAYYGRRYTIGALANGRLWFNKVIEEPWANQETVLSFADSLKPVMSSLAYRGLNAPTFKSLQPDKIQNINGFVCVIPSENNSKFGNWCTETAFFATGRLVLFYNTAEEEQGELAIKKFFCKISPVWKGNEALIVKPPSMQGKCIGGAFYYERFNAGSLNLWLGGIIEVENSTTLKLKKVNEQQKFNIDSADSTHR